MGNLFVPFFAFIFDNIVGNLKSFNDEFKLEEDEDKNLEKKEKEQKKKKSIEIEEGKKSDTIKRKRENT